MKFTDEQLASSSRDFVKEAAEEHVRELLELFPGGVRVLTGPTGLVGYEKFVDGRYVTVDIAEERKRLRP
jgi:hypothetical protein